MADISKIKLPNDSTTYTLKDSNAVQKAGDTMTGALTMSNGASTGIKGKCSDGSTTVNITGITGGDNIFLGNTSIGQTVIYGGSNGLTTIGNSTTETDLKVWGDTTTKGLIGTYNYTYGAQAPGTAISSPVEGQIYFKLV